MDARKEKVMDNVLVAKALDDIQNSILGSSLIIANLRKLNNSSDFDMFNDYLDSLKTKFPDMYDKIIDILWKNLF